MDAYDPATVFSSIDHGGRYAYGNQPRIVHWNLARLGEALLPLFADRARAGRRGRRTRSCRRSPGATRRTGWTACGPSSAWPAPADGDAALAADLLDAAAGAGRRLHVGACARCRPPSPATRPEPGAVRRPGRVRRVGGAVARAPGRRRPRRRRRRRGDGPRQPDLHPAQPPRRGGARPPPPTATWRPFDELARRRDAPVRRAARAATPTPARRRPTAAATSRSAAPDVPLATTSIGGRPVPRTVAAPEGSKRLWTWGRARLGESRSPRTTRRQKLADRSGATARSARARAIWPIRPVREGATAGPVGGRRHLRLPELFHHTGHRDGARHQPAERAGREPSGSWTPGGQPSQSAMISSWCWSWRGAPARTPDSPAENRYGARVDGVGAVGVVDLDDGAAVGQRR